MKNIQNDWVLDATSSHLLRYSILSVFFAFFIGIVSLFRLTISGINSVTHPIVAGAILTGYAGVISVATLRSKMKSKAPEAAAAPAAAASTAPSSDILPSVESPDFEKFLESDAFGKFVESEDSLMKWVDSVTAE